ncbi:MAG: hypothetical protein K2Y22_04910 [Candidatus Obscuribacterales bacterium]|nr:hypothetical protein [Candidatus Obscuribacterales bacterium]
MRNLAIGLGICAIVIALAFALPHLMPGIDRNTYYPTTADTSIYAEQQPAVMVEPMPETVSVVRRPAIVETKVIRRPVTRTRIAARRPVLVEKEVDYDHIGRIEEIEYDYDHHTGRNFLSKIGHKIFH